VDAGARVNDVDGIHGSSCSFSSTVLAEGGSQSFETCGEDPQLAVKRRPRLAANDRDRSWRLLVWC
jgi:hypothetical protein